MEPLRFFLTLIIAAGILQAFAGLFLVRRFAKRTQAAPPHWPAVTILKPVFGDEPLLEDAIASFCEQDYPQSQLVIGAQNPNDPALDAVRRVQARFPNAHISVVIDTTPHGTNGKISNLINMLPAAAHDILVIADSDLHVRPDYLKAVIATLASPGTGLVTTLGAGEAVSSMMAARLGAMHLAHNFLPSALIGEALGRQDCLGGTMALTRQTLARAGGLPVVANCLADDNILGRKINALGLAVRLAPTLPVVTVQETRLQDLWLHELRWARTIRSLAPLSAASCVVQYPLFWSLLAVAVTNAAPWSLICLATAWLARATITQAIDAALAPVRARGAGPIPAWLLPLRDVLSVAEIAYSFTGDEVVWRGRTMVSDRLTAATE